MIRKSRHLLKISFNHDIRRVSAVLMLITITAVLVLGSCDFLDGSTGYTEPEITSISISPQSTTVDVNESIIFTVTAHYSDGSSETIEIGTQNWNISDDTVINETGAGRFNAISGGGSSTVTVHYDGYSATAVVNVNEEVLGGDDAFLLTVNRFGTPDGTGTAMSGVFDSQGELLGIPPSYNTFTGGLLETVMHAPQPSSFYTASSWEAVFTTGFYDLFLVIDLDNDGNVSESDIGTIQEVEAASRIELTLDSDDFEPVVEESIIITGSSLTSGNAVMIGYWLVPGTGMIENPVEVNEYISDPVSGEMPPSGYRGFSMNFFEFFDTSTGAVTTNLNSYLIPGTYDLSIAIDSDGSDDIGEGDYLFYMENITVDGSGTDITHIRPREVKGQGYPNKRKT